MRNEYDLQNIDKFKIDPHVWLETLLAIAGDKEKKKEVVQTLAEQSGFSNEEAEKFIDTTIHVLITDTRSN